MLDDGNGTKKDRFGRGAREDVEEQGSKPRRDREEESKRI